MEDTSCTVLTRTQRNFKAPTTSSAPFVPVTNKLHIVRISDHSLKAPKIQVHHKSVPEPSFDIVEFCKSSRIQISLAEYFKLNPKELDKLVKFVHGEHSQIHSNIHQFVDKYLVP